MCRCGSPTTTTGTSCASRSRPQRARANCAAPRIPSTPSSAPTSALFATRRPDDVTVYGDVDTGVHPHADAAAGTDSRHAAEPGAVPSDAIADYAEPGDPRLVAATDRLPRAGDDPARRRGHQLPQRHGADQERRVVRGEGRTQRRRPATLHRSAGRRSPTRSGCGSSPSCATTSRRSRTCSPRRCSCSTTATWARRRPARADGATPAGTCWSPSRASSSPRRSRSAPCCSTHGRSSSTTSATRARFPPSTRPSWIDGSRWRQGCSSSPTASSPPSASDCWSR